MAKIQELLDNLLHKKLGRDVRQSIHDSIEQCYKDATGHPESVAEVVRENQEMQEHLNNTPYMFLEEGEAEDLPVHTINDEETSTASTWSSEKINGKIQEVFQSASNGKNKLAAAIGNGSTADMTWDELANKTLKVKYERKETTSKDGVYFDKAFKNVILWVVIGTNSEYERTGSVIERGSYTENWGGATDIVTLNNMNKVTYVFTDISETKLHAKMYQTSNTSTKTWYDCYQIGYN